jgi:hypothetical protein
MGILSPFTALRCRAHYYSARECLAGTSNDFAHAVRRAQPAPRRRPLDYFVRVVILVSVKVDMAIDHRSVTGNAVVRGCERSTF